MLRPKNLPVSNICMPIKLWPTPDQKRVDEIAESMFKDGQYTPIWVRSVAMFPSHVNLKFAT